MTEESNVLLGKQPCSSCGSSDAKTYYLDGGSKCFSCGRAPRVDSPDSVSSGSLTRIKRAKSPKVDMEDIKSFEFADLGMRSIHPSISQMFNVREHEGVVYMPYTKSNQVVGYKARRKSEKTFYAVGNMGKMVDPFGWGRVSETGRLLIITEGEMDAMAATQMLMDKGKKYKVVSIPNGAQSAVEYLKANLDKFNNFEKIVLNFDGDEVGQESQQACLKVLNAGSAYSMQLPEGFKDANDLLMNGKSYQYLDALNNAKQYKPDGIVAGVDTWEVYTNKPDVTSYPYPETWSELNKMTYGIRLGELDTVTSGTSAGKTQFMREVMYHFMTTTDLPVGIISLEEPITDTIESYLELDLNKRISLPDVDATEEEKYGAWQKTLGNGRVFLYDAFGGEEDSVVNQIRYFAKGLGVKLVLVDHLHMLLDGKDTEKEQIERIMLRLKKLTQELGIWIGLIAHLKKSTGGATFEEGAVANLDDLKGSSAIKQLSNGVLVLSRDQMAEDTLTKNTTHIDVKKCRFTGRTGRADSLLFEDDTGRMIKLKDDDIPW